MMTKFTKMVTQVKGGQLFEALLGSFVVGVVLSFVGYGVLRVGGDTGTAMTSHEARFLAAGGLRGGSDVVMNGVVVGEVLAVTLDMDTYEAVVTFEKRADLPLPQDTQAAIGSEGLTGGKYLLLHPGKEKTILTQGTPIGRTIDYESFEDKVSKIIFLAAGDDG